MISRAKYSKQYYQAHKEEISKRTKEWRIRTGRQHRYSKPYYEKNKEEIKASRRKYREENKDKIRAQQRVWYENKRKERELFKRRVLTYYGNGKLACVRCGQDDLRALTLDHIKAIGRQKRRVTGINFYKQLEVSRFPEGFQTLCANCQMVKMFEENEWKLNL